MQNPMRKAMRGGIRSRLGPRMPKRLSLPKRLPLPKRLSLPKRLPIRRRAPRPLHALSWRERMNFLITNRVPRKALTQWMGWYSGIENPHLTRISIRVWRMFARDLDLAEAKSRSFTSLHDCFVRELKEGARSIDERSDIVISPCASKAYRNWNAAGYAAVGDWAAAHGLQVVLCGGPSALEREYGERITAEMAQPPLNLIGRTTLKGLVAVLARARAVVAPDAGPAHLATAVGTPVVGLYAATNPDRARPYLSAAYVVNRYPEAVQGRYGKIPEALPWGIRVREPGTMDRIEVADVVGKLEAVIAGTGRPRGNQC